MSAGRAVVGSKNGGMSELLANQCGLLVHPKRPKDIASAICQLIENPQLRYTFGQNARQKVIHDYSLEKTAKASMSHFSELIKTTLK